MTYESANPTEIVGVTFIAQVLSMIRRFGLIAIFTEEGVGRGGKMSIVNTISLWVIPCVIGFILLYGTIKKVPTYESSLREEKKGFKLRSLFYRLWLECSYLFLYFGLQVH